MKSRFSCLVLLFFTVSGFPVFAQYEGYYFSVGYNPSFVRGEDMNFIIQRYNETRDDCNRGYCLSKKMSKLKFAQWPTFSFGMSSNGSLIEFQWTGRKQVLTAIGQSNNDDPVRRDLKVILNSFSTNYAYAFDYGSGFFAPGFSLDIGKTAMGTRVDYEKNFIGEVEYDKLFSDLMIGTTFFLNIGINLSSDGLVGILIRPYYQFRWLKVDLDEVNRVLNPNTWQNDPTGLESNFNNGGIQVGLMFGKRE
jgi:hypothetical protein